MVHAQRNHACVYIYIYNNLYHKKFEQKIECFTGSHSKSLPENTKDSKGERERTEKGNKEHLVVTHQRHHTSLSLNNFQLV